MNIGIVTTWMERGAAYVSKTYMNLLLLAGHEVFIFARGGEIIPSKGEEHWNEKYVTRSAKYMDTRIEKKLFYKWLVKNSIEAVLFNEQQDVRIIIDTKLKFPQIKLAAYVDYYTEKTIPWFELYDFVICNTYRHMQAMGNHPQKFYLKWGTDINLYKPMNNSYDKIVFFHSVGMSNRKGTDILIEAFIKGEIYKSAKLLIHSQIPIECVCPYNSSQLKEYGIEVIEKTVTAPGLYYMGDVYVYPTRLDGLGLTMYEALASGLPLIVPDFPPMNEVGDDSCVKKVKICDYYCRNDAYYFPMVICDTDDLIKQMNWYIYNPNELFKQKKAAREYAVSNYNILDRVQMLSDIFENAKTREPDSGLIKTIQSYYRYSYNFFSSIRMHRNIATLVNRIKNK